MCLQAAEVRTYSAVLAERNLRDKLGRPAFRDDLTPLVRAIPKEYDVMMAGELVIAELFSNPTSAAQT
jgi:hypothetical protein